MILFKNKKEIHLPDLTFCKLCEDKYGVNRGLYNTIDYWFYEKGIENISERRSIILDFLQVVCDRSKISTPNRKYKFGHGGLTIKLNEYWEKRTAMKNKSG
jgi:hypothetical protein